MFQNGLQIYQIILGTLSYLFLLLLIDITTKRLERNLNNSINNIRMLRAKDYYSLSLNLDFEYIDTENYRIKFEKGLILIMMVTIWVFIILYLIVKRYLLA